ncbi:MAG: MOSC domain-containing protein [Thaumarchaeota archaeon]|nr:MOSC domain-containing protein [Candidatus Calditenuaceae archaeon]MDW8187512.1 MOSC domain-containing protein [Nitrososphaerota archaeon]
MNVGRVASIRRYPLLGCGGEELSEAQVLDVGVEGDRIYALREKSSNSILEPVGKSYDWGKTITEPKLLLLNASLREGRLEVELPAGITLSEDEIDEGLSEFLSREVEVLEAPWVMRSRSLRGRAIHLLTTSSIDALRSRKNDLDFSIARFRPNLYLVVGEGAPDFCEDLWVGKELLIGKDLVLKVEARNPRCAVTTLPQRFVSREPEVLSSIVEINHGHLGVVCSVVREGRVSVGDYVELRG